MVERTKARLLFLSPRVQEEPERDVWIVGVPRRGDDVLVDTIPHEVLRVFWETFHDADEPATDDKPALIVIVRAHDSAGLATGGRG